MTDRELMQQALEGLEKWRWGKDPRGADGYITALRERLAQPEQEAVAWMLGDEVYKVKQCRLFSKNPGEEIPGQIPLYTAPQPAQHEHVIDCPRCGHCCPQSIVSGS